LRFTWIALTAWFAGCSQATDTLDGAPRAARELARADTVAAADFDGDGVDELILVTDGVARWDGGELDLGGGLMATARDDRGGDGREVLFLGTGATRDQREAPARVWRVDAGGGLLAWEQQGARNQVTDLRVTDDGVWVAAFIDASHVAGGWLVDGAREPLVREKFATRQLPLGPEHAAVGRIYGDQPKSDGDLRVMGKGITPRTLPTLRGVRSLASADLNKDGEPELLVGDGWHFAYGKQAVARLRLLEGPDWSEGRTIASFDGEYTIREIIPVGDRLVAVGTRSVHLLERDALGWSDTVLAPIEETGQAVVIQEAGGTSVLISGDPARVVPLP